MPRAKGGHRDPPLHALAMTGWEKRERAISNEMALMGRLAHECASSIVELAFIKSEEGTPIPSSQSPHAH